MHPQQSASQSYVASVGARLAADECRTWWEDWAGVPVLVGRRADFKWRWMGTKLHLFTVAAAVPEITIPIVADIPAVGALLSGQTILVYAGIAAVVVLQLLLDEGDPFLGLAPVRLELRLAGAAYTNPAPTARRLPRQMRPHPCETR